MSTIPQIPVHDSDCTLMPEGWKLPPGLTFDGYHDSDEHHGKTILDLVRSRLEVDPDDLTEGDVFYVNACWTQPQEWRVVRSGNPFEVERVDNLAAAMQPAAGPETCAPAILEAMSYHERERDDLTLEDAVKAFRFGYKEVRQRDDRAMLAQIIHLLASAAATPQPVARQDEDGIGVQVGVVVRDHPVHGWHMQALVPWSVIGEGAKLYVRPTAADAGGLSWDVRGVAQRADLADITDGAGMLIASMHPKSARAVVAAHNATLAPRPTAVMAVAHPGWIPLADHEEVMAEHRDLVRQLDVALNGDGAAQQASLCDIVAQVRREGIKADKQPAMGAGSLSAPIMFGKSPVENMQIDFLCGYLCDTSAYDGKGLEKAWGELVQFYLAHRATASGAGDLADAARLDLIEAMIGEYGYFYMHNNRAREPIGLGTKPGALRADLDELAARRAANGAGDHSSNASVIGGGK